MIYAFEPVFDENSRLLILGSMPSVRSLEVAFYYGNPQNRFWGILQEATGDPVPPEIPARKAFLLRHGIALWDVIASCEREGSLDSSIRNATPADLSRLPLSRLKIFTNGALAASLLRRYHPGLSFTALPSTSPANRVYFDRGLWLRELRLALGPDADRHSLR